MRLALSLILAAGTAFAQDVADPLPRGDVTAFEACFLQLMIDNPDNPMLDIIGPITCGERHIPMGQTCDALGYMLFDRRAACKADDLAFWEAQIASRSAAAIADGRNGVGSLHETGLNRCDEIEAAGEDALDCRIETNWRTTLEFISADLVAELTGATE